MRAGRVAGIQLILNNWFLALIALFTLAGVGGKVAGVFAAVLWHETAHALAAMALGYKVREMELLPFGGVARIDRISEAGWMSEIIIAAAGPLASLVMAAVMHLGMTKLPEWELLFDFYLKANLMLAFFNLLPGLPLDGGRILRALLSRRWPYSTATIAVCNISKGVSLVLVGWAAIEFWLSRTMNLSFVVAAVFLYTAACHEKNLAGFRTMRIMANKKAELTARGIMPTTHFTVMQDTRVRDVVRVFSAEYYHIVLVIDAKYHLCGTLTETDVWEWLPAKGLYAKIGEFL